jgi:ubiquinone/menaquinone biosynthesis C-methylase UbiE
MVDSKAWDWNKVKGDHECHWQEPAIESYYLINRWLGQNKKDFLDLGCGLGRHTIQFAKAGFKTSGFDLSEASIARTGEYATKANVAVDLKVGDMLSLPYADNSIDCVYCRNVISHTDTAGMRKIISELKRVLRKGGECYLTLGSKQAWGFQQDWPIVDENTKIRVEDGPENGIPHFYADYNLIQDLFEDFDIIKIIQVEDFINRGDDITSSFHWHVLICHN